MEISAFILNESLPHDYKKIIEEIGSTNTDFAFAITDEPINLFIVLSGVSDNEINRVQHGAFDFTISTIANVPFIVLDFYDGLSFDMSISSMRNLKSREGNAVNIFLVEKKGCVLKATRTIGVDNKLMNKLIDDVMYLQREQKEKQFNFEDRVANIFFSNSTLDIKKVGSTQHFERNDTNAGL